VNLNRVELVVGHDDPEASTRLSSAMTIPKPQRGSHRILTVGYPTTLLLTGSQISIERMTLRTCRISGSRR
jgi:hypothetical protein